MARENSGRLDHMDEEHMHETGQTVLASVQSFAETRLHSGGFSGEDVGNAGYIFEPASTVPSSSTTQALVDSDSEASLTVEDKIRKRFMNEGWTTDDLYAALLQACLLTYRSPEDAEERYGFRYVKSAPEDYASNCPWNDWPPPSKSLLHANLNQRSVLKRVRVHLHREPIPESYAVIAFASVETQETGACLCLRRGARIMASISVAMLSATIVGQRLVMLATTSYTTDPAVPVAQVLLKFEDDERLRKFCDMLLEAH